jgi:hypothetical protein
MAILAVRNQQDVLDTDVMYQPALFYCILQDLLCRERSSLPPVLTNTGQLLYDF